KDRCSKSAESSDAVKDFNGDRSLILACNILCDLGIRAVDPIEQIKNLPTEQQFQVFDHIMKLFQSPTDNTSLPEIYEVMKHLNATKKKYGNFFRIVSQNTANCSRNSLSKALIKAYITPTMLGGGELPELLEEKFGEIGIQEAYAY